MNRATGASAVVKFCQENDWGTTPVSPTSVFGLSLKSETLGSTKNIFQSEMISDERCTVGLGDGNRAVNGSIVTDLLPEGLEVLIRHLLGNPLVTTTGSAAPYTHILKGSKGFLPGLTIEKSFVSIARTMTYAGCRVNSLTVNLVQEGFHEASFDFIGKGEVVTEDATGKLTGQVYPDKNGFNGYQCVVSTTVNPTTGAVVAGSYHDLSYLVSGSFTINNNVETDGYVIGSDVRASSEYGKRECSGSFSVFFQDTILYNIYKNGTECGIKFTFDNSLGQKMIFEFPIVKLGGEAPKIASAAGLNLPLTFQARRDAVTLGTDVKVTFENTLSSIEVLPYQEGV